MHILFIGDIFASPGRHIVADHLQDIKETSHIDLAIANAENAAGGFGITPSIAEELFSMGLDVLTSGNHIWDKKEIFDYLPRQPKLLRPANYADETPGHGAEQRGLARLGGADDAEDFVALDVEGNAVNNLLVTVSEAKVLDDDLGVRSHHQDR